MKITRRTLLGTIAAGLSAIPAFKASAEGDWPSRVVRLVSPYGAGGASDISLRILAEQFGRSLQPAIHRREQAGGGHPRRQRDGLARRAGRIHLPLCGSALCDGRSAVREAELQPQGSAAGGDGDAGAVVPGGECAGAVQDRSGDDRLRQVEARGPDLWFAGRGLAAASGRRAAVQGRRRQGPDRSLPRRQHGLHRIAGEPSRRHADRARHRLAAHPERRVARARRGARPSAARSTRKP